MDQFTEDELGLNMLANPNRMNDNNSHNVNMGQPLFDDDDDESDNVEVESNNNYFQHVDENPRQSSNNKYGSNNNFFDDNASDVSKVSMEPTEDILKKKNFLLTKLKRLQQKGVELTKNVSINTPLHDLENEYMMAKKEQSLESNLEWCKQGLVYICSFLETGNKMFKTGAKLDGWSEEIYNTRDNYDDVFEELIDKYGGDIEMAPEIRLIMMLVGSALAVHMSNTMMSSGAGMQNFMNEFHNQKQAAAPPQQAPQQQMPLQQMPLQQMPLHNNMNPSIPNQRPPIMTGPDPRLVEELLNEDINSVVSDSSVSSDSSNENRRKKKTSVNIAF